MIFVYIFCKLLRVWCSTSVVDWLDRLVSKMMCYIFLWDFKIRSHNHDLRIELGCGCECKLP